MVLVPDLRGITVGRGQRDRKVHDMGNKVFCGGLPWATDDQQLAEALSEFGEVKEAKVISDKETGRSRGFGFVTFASEDSAAQALKAQNFMIEGRQVRIDAANDSGSRGGGGARPGGGGRSAPRHDDGGGRRDDYGDRGGGRGRDRR
jgi:cold-inducible RNA-binding protein